MARRRGDARPFQDEERGVGDGQDLRGPVVGEVALAGGGKRVERVGVLGDHIAIEVELHDAAHAPGVQPSQVGVLVQRFFHDDEQ